MRTFAVGVFVFVLLSAGIAGGWTVMNYYSPGRVGTPAHAGVISNGHPEGCTNVNLSVKPRAKASRTVLLEENQLVRGTFGVDGGFGRVDVLMRIVTPQGLEMFASPRASNYDFSFPVKVRGGYTFVFDNRYSMYTAKSVALYYCIDSGRPVLGG